MRNSSVWGSEKNESALGGGRRLGPESKKAGGGLRVIVAKKPPPPHSELRVHRSLGFFPLSQGAQGGVRDCACSLLSELESGTGVHC